MNEQPMDEIQATEMQIYELTQKLEKLRRDSPARPTKNYTFQTLEGETSLLKLFGDKEVLFAIHNMGQACRYCTLWADGLNGFLPHLEDKFAVVLLSEDAPALQRQFANSRGWRYRLASHGGGDYIREQSAVVGQDNQPGIVCYQRQGDKIYRKNASAFGPGDLYCSLWHVLSLAGVNEWTPQYNYWRRPEKLKDGGQNIN